MTLEMTLLSDSSPGSGEGLAGIIDKDISYDSWGIPYIPAKRIKGILRESARELYDAGLINNAPENIFGKSGSEEGCAFKISNGRIKNYDAYEKFFALIADERFSPLQPLFNRNSTLSFFTYTRTQTTIDNEIGVAKEDTLRTCRVLRKGLVFTFSLDCDPLHKEDLKEIAKVTRFFGDSRTRGLGHIKLELKDDEKIQNEKDYSHTTIENYDENKYYRIPIYLENNGQLLLTQQVGENQVSEHYIPGSIIQGVLARYYIRKKSIDPSKDVRFRELFISGRVIFSNAYPTDGKLDFYPSPCSIVKEKDRERYFDLASYGCKDKLISESIQTKGRLGDFANIDNDKVKTISVATEAEYHHRRPADRSIGHALKENVQGEKGDPGTFFQFEVLSSGQNFVGYILGRPSDLVELLDCFNGINEVYLGKSKTAQYGRTNLRFGKIEPLDLAKKTWMQGEDIVITFISDMILFNEYGFCTPDVIYFINELANILKVEKEKIKIQESFVRYRNIGGFLGVWNLPKPQFNVLSKGTVLVLKNETGNSIDLGPLLGKSFGARKEEGFGQIRINWHGAKDVLEKEESLKTSLISNTKPTTDERLIEFIKYIFQEYIESVLKKISLNKGNEFSSLDNITPSFLNRIQAIIQASSSIQNLTDRLNQLKDRAKKQLKILADALYLYEKDKSFMIHKERFEEELLKMKPEFDNANETFIDQLKHIFEEITENMLFRFYKTYAICYLDILRFRKRRG